MRYGWDELMALGVPLGTPGGPSTAFYAICDKPDARACLVHAVAQEEGLDLTDYGRVDPAVEIGEDGSVSVLLSFGPKAR